MSKLTLDDLRKLRGEKVQEYSRRNNEQDNSSIIIGMGTCGIAAGAKDTLNSFVEALDEHGLTNVKVKQTGCMGACNVEPTVEIIVPGMPTIVYGNVNKDIAKKIVLKHIIGKELLDDHIQDKPAMDIIDN
ncbi:MAG: (2Fe-2S) ferredoxin domain-containing protein [Candidatus Margulisbacteria bacterium]|nr:(2Fe-2S) ferredoxin domain-containing protein [Candidatus Margulisiibacteriota bacterium]